ncbi:acetyl-CoA carboxylase biotin carboxylase subunit [Nocardiopsis halophila]|uniref:acetyl-CoA carboxylase biotin carboxylase subunit n=1 Tax=Nocardiopsis halophila TaxID=141692 RepID=UPI00034B70E2|nr:biotin carboxylase N-terminal domain-containing protein [Nocardiopsis halophila]
MFDTVLIANRGEIALRVQRTCRAMGLRTAAVYTTDERDAAVVHGADRAVCIGPPGTRSYLDIPALIEAAKAAEADAIHPGYGLLSEVPDFAEVCAANGITFIGPSPAVMDKLGDKAATRTLFGDLGAPLLPGSPRALESAFEAKAVADAIGYPVMIKAAAGGGGRGIQIVRTADDLVQAFQETHSRARTLFNDGRVYVERYVEGARHIEVQVLCDRHGNGVSLGERDCSVQRRHQKLIEETPAPGLDRATAEAMGASAVELALAVGYEGVGTFEFIVDSANEFHFIEVNCRLQVEHPVTEMTTGIDLVREQVLAAAGEPLSLSGDQASGSGVSIECRVNAEDPERGFVPTPGELRVFQPPGGPFVRVDSHCYTGYTVPPSYDSLLAKTVVWGPDREQALQRLDTALAEFAVEGPGVRTTVPLLRRVIADPRFRAGRHTTSLIGDVIDGLDL